MLSDLSAVILNVPSFILEPKMSKKTPPPFFTPFTVTIWNASLHRKFVLITIFSRLFLNLSQHSPTQSTFLTWKQKLESHSKLYGLRSHAWGAQAPLGNRALTDEAENRDSTVKMDKTLIECIHVQLQSCLNTFIFV
jgi:hypothetical protein